MYCVVEGPKRYSIFIKNKDKNIKKGQIITGIMMTMNTTNK